MSTNKITDALAAMRSCIKCGEPWTPTMDEMFADATRELEAICAADVEDTPNSATMFTRVDCEVSAVALDGYGVFDEDDLGSDDAEPFAVFRSEDEAKGFCLMLGGGCVDPVVRHVSLSGTWKEPAPR